MSHVEIVSCVTGVVSRTGIPMMPVCGTVVVAYEDQLLSEWRGYSVGHNAPQSARSATQLADFSSVGASKSASELVGRTGLEPVTPCASCKCATNCANGPSDKTLPPANCVTEVLPGGHDDHRPDTPPTLTIGSAPTSPRTGQRPDPRPGSASEADRRGRLHRPPRRHRAGAGGRDRRGTPQAGARPGHRPCRQPLRGGAHDCGCTTCWSTGATFEKIPVHPNVLPVVEGVLDPGLLISSLSSIAIGPDEQAQPIHADDQLIPLTRPHVPIICNTMWAITDFTEENGATRLVPGSHLRDEAPNPLELYDTFPPKCPRAASSSGSEASGMAVARTAPTSAGSASP